MTDLNLLRPANLISSIAENDLVAAQRVAAQTLVRLLCAGGAVAEVGDYAGFACAEVMGIDGRRAIVAPLYDWAPEDDSPAGAPGFSGTWEFAVRDEFGAPVPQPDGDDTYGCPDIWLSHRCGLEFEVGLAVTEGFLNTVASSLGWVPATAGADCTGPIVGGVAAKDFATEPYPGVRPSGSFVIDRDERCWPVRVDESQPSGWAVDTEEVSICLDAWLVGLGATPMAGRVPLLGYGSNACPGKVLLNETPLPSVHLACTMFDLASVWCTGKTGRGNRPVTLAVVAGHQESAAIMMCDEAELGVLDGVEGRRGKYYELFVLKQGRVVLENGARVLNPAAYVGGRPGRWPLLVGGCPVPRVDLAHDGVCALVDKIGTTEQVNPMALGRLIALDNYPDPAECIPTLFVYGTLKPNRSRWGLLEPHVLDNPVPAGVAGDLRDTGHGYPALNATANRAARGVLCLLRPTSAESLLHDLDQVEGVAHGLFSRQARNVDGCLSWVYVAGTTAGVGVPIETW